MKKTRALFLVPIAIGACGDEPLALTAPADPSAALVEADVANEAELQAALDLAAAGETRSTIRLQRGVTITLTNTLTHAGSGPLEIDGRGATLVGPAGGDALDFTGGADLSIRDLTVQGSGEHGIYVEVPAGRAGTLSVVVRSVALRDNGFAGLWIDDQVHDSPASVSLQVLDSEVSGNNTAGIGEELDYDGVLAAADKDGIRVNEGGAGQLTLFMRNSHFFGNQADAIELDETGDGDVVSTVLNSTFNDNGDQLQFPDDPPAGFPGDPADYEKDLEDGFDIDENDAGSVIAHFVNVEVNDNEDEGIDLDEPYDGSIEMTGNNIVANGNFGAGIKLTESEEQPGSDGDIIVDLSNVTANGSRDSRGMRLEEFQGGDVLGRIVRGTFDGNASDGFRIEQIDEGAIGFDFLNTAFTNNGGRGLRLEAAGRVTLVKPTFGGNAGGDRKTDGVEVVVRGN
jgi:hypothetical protein